MENRSKYLNPFWICDIMPQHGDYDKNTNQIYCGYWMSLDDWEEIHKYTPNLDGFEKTEEESKDEQY
jgi:hypothetical protein